MIRESTKRLQDKALRRVAGKAINAGGIIIRQRGTRVHAGENVGMGKDHTLFALVNGHVKFAVKGAAQHQYAVVIPA